MLTEEPGCEVGVAVKLLFVKEAGLDTLVVKVGVDAAALIVA
jgi:hypothetical protein